MPLSVQSVQALYADFAQGNLSAIFAVLSPNTKIYKPDSLPHGGVYQGRDGFISLMTSMNNTWDSIQIVPESFLASDEGIVATGECIGKKSNRADTIRFPFVHFWKIQLGVVVEIWLYYWDTAAIIAYLKGTTS